MTRYPQGLPRPQREDYSFDENNRILRTEMQSGEARQRPEFDSGPSQLTLSFVFTHLEARLFETWAKNIAKADWFIFPLYSPMGYDIDTECRFKETPKTSTPIGVTHWRQTCLIEVRQKPELPGDWALLPDFVLYPDIFDRIMNEELPLDGFQVGIEIVDSALNSEWPLA